MHDYYAHCEWKLLRKRIDIDASMDQKIVKPIPASSLLDNLENLLIARKACADLVAR